MKKRSSQKFKKYQLFIVIGIISFALTYIIIRQNNSTPTCGNSISCTSETKVRVENNIPGIFAGKKVFPPIIDLASEKTENVLGDSVPAGQKHIYIDLSTQTLTAYQAKTQVLKTLVSTGKWGRTPTGNFNIWQKLRATRMTGGSGSDYYDLPNVEYTMYFYSGYGTHTAYWHNNFGHVMSHGCINMRRVDAKKLYEWADGPTKGQKGTPVSVCDQITKDNQCIQNNPVL